MVCNVEYPESHRGKRVMSKQINTHWQRERRREREGKTVVKRHYKSTLQFVSVEEWQSSWYTKVVHQDGVCIPNYTKLTIFGITITLAKLGA